MRRSLLLFVVLTAALGVSGCSGTLDDAIDKVVPKREAQYKSSRSLPPLEVPPDLSASTLNESLAVPASSGSATYSDYSAGNRKVAAQTAQGVLPLAADARVVRVDDKRWLRVDAPPEEVWPKVRDFWLNQGFLISVEDPAIGIIETDWAEQRERIEGGLWQSLMEKLSSALYGTATRDKFRSRLERGEQPEVTEVFISHRGAEEVVVESPVPTSGERTRNWQPRPSDPELEAEMIARLLVFLGAGEEAARQQVAQTLDQRRDRARIARDDTGAALLTLEEGFSRAWRRTGLALDRVGFTVEDRDRSRGLYFVRYVDPDKDLGKEKKGFFSKLAFWRSDDRNPQDDAYLISLVGGRDVEATTDVVVLTKEGERDSTRTADRILSLLHQQLK